MEETEKAEDAYNRRNKKQMARKRRISATQKRLAELKKDRPFGKASVRKGRGRPMGEFGPKTVLDRRLAKERSQCAEIEFGILKIL